jgi:hypothetical protein
VKPLPTGIARTPTGYRAFIHVSWPGYPNGRLVSKRFPPTALREAEAWREGQRIAARRRKDDLVLREHAAACDARRLPRSETSWCYIYFARSGETVKIGRSLEPLQRVRALQMTHAGDLELLATVAAHVTLEGALHERFAHLRTRPNGEWFRLDHELIAFIRAVQQGANPVALLFEDPPPCPAS